MQGQHTGHASAHHSPPAVHDLCLVGRAIGGDDEKLHFVGASTAAQLCLSACTQGQGCAAVVMSQHLQ